MSGCVHLADYIKEFRFDSYKLVHAYFSACISVEARKRKALSCFCYVCGQSGSNLYSCLHCIYFGCKGSHLLDHSKSQRHHIWLELAHGGIFCNICKDFVYHEECTRIAQRNLYKEAKSLQKSVVYKSWFPSQTEISYLLQHPKRREVTSANRIGLRGLLNLGSTCFMNCIVQVLIHTPLLRDYFLSEKHHCQQTTKCLVCEISKLFQEFYSGEAGPISLHRLLHLIWNNAKHLAGYEQQDAHEFFIAILDLLHTHCKNGSESLEGLEKSTSPHTIQPSTTQLHKNQCNCIIDQIFTGRLQSDVVCQNCLNVSTTIDPFWDISLDLGSSFQQSTPKSLNDCLERFTKPEHLGSSAKIKCSRCQSYQESTKQLSMRTLPIVASFHLKRFEHSSLYDKKKISSFIRFPPELEMSPFLSSGENPHSGDFRYSLYAVVNHVGSIDAGHYTAYVRHQKDVWVKCDDNTITTVSLKQVLDSEGYLLFYHKKLLEYR